jgi:hypothetical protein
MKKHEKRYYICKKTTRFGVIKEYDVILYSITFDKGTCFVFEILPDENTSWVFINNLLHSHISSIIITDLSDNKRYEISADTFNEAIQKGNITLYKILKGEHT